MNLKQILYGAALLAIAGACSDDTPRPGDSSVAQSRPDGYMAVQVNLPQAQGTRADNDIFLDGSENEYLVTDGCILIFAGKDETSAKLRGAFSLNQGDKYDSLVENPYPTGGDNITTSYKKVVEVSNIKRTEEEPNLYGLVMLNYAGVGEIGANNMFVLRSNGKTVETLADLTTGTTDYLTNFIGSNKNYFFMANAPMYTKVGGPVKPADDGQLITLIKLNDEAIFETESQASAEADRGNLVGEFFVERAVAKTTLSVDTDVKALAMTIPVIDGVPTESALAISNVEWALGNQEDLSYLVRNTANHPWIQYCNEATKNANKYRFVSGAVMGKTMITNYETVEDIPVFRTYWCEDPHYGINKTAADDTKATFVAAGDTPLYSFENTFDVAHQNHYNTTRAIIKAVLNEGKTFFTVNGRQDLLYKSDKDAMVYAQNYIYQSRAIYTAIKDALDEALQEEANYTEADVTAILDNVQDKITVEWGEYETLADGTHKYKEDNDGFRVPNAEGYLEVKEIKISDIKYTIGEKEFTLNVAIDADELIEAVNSLYKVAAYVGGVNYYDVRIKHFAGVDAADNADLAPWDPKTLNIVTPTEDVEDSYLISKGEEKAENDFLGRYGMVRNNWYDIKITKISHFGKPALTNLTIEGDGTPDDEYDVEKWISFKVNVLAWALRQQTVIL